MLLARVLDKSGRSPMRAIVMFYCADPMEQTLDGSDTRYYESIDLPAPITRRQFSPMT